MSYPLSKYSFQVDWGGTQIGFSEVSGLDVEVEVIEYRHGASPEFSKTKMPGMKKYSNITLKRGTFQGDNEFYDWFNEVKLNSVDRRSLTISLLDEEGAPAVTWKVNKAFVVKMQSTDLKSDASEVAIESIEIAHEGLVVQND